MAKDEYVIVLDFLPYGKASDKKSEPIAQVIGEKYFNLLEVVIKDNLTVKPGDRLYIGEEKRDHVKYVKGRISYDELTGFAKAELEKVLENIIIKEEKRFVNLFNIAGPITTRLHSLELLPGIGKRHLWQIIQERKKKPFESFKELQERIKMLPEPKRMIIKRILEELKGEDKRRLIVGSNLI